MPDDIETTARAVLAEVLPGVAPETVPPDAELTRFGLDSLHKVVFLTSLCDRTQVGLEHFTEHDVAAMTTLRQVVDALSEHAAVA